MRKSAYTFIFVRECACDFVLAKYRTLAGGEERECQREHPESTRERRQRNGQKPNITNESDF